MGLLRSLHCFTNPFFMKRPGAFQALGLFMLRIAARRLAEHLATSAMLAVPERGIRSGRDDRGSPWPRGGMTRPGRGARNLCVGAALGAIAQARHQKKANPREAQLSL
jgi:hypothetical protein